MYVSSVGSGDVKVNGTIKTASPSYHTVSTFTTVQFEAVPAEGYEFAGWSGDLTGIENPTSLYVTCNKTITAQFKQIPPRPSYSYYVPYFQGDTKNYTSLALRNISDSQSTDVSVQIYNMSGSVIEAINLSAMAPKAQWTQALRRDLLQKGWIKVLSSEKLSGLAWIGTIEDSWPVYMADISLISELATLLIVPHVAQDENWDTIIFVCNPNSATVTVNLTYVDSNGSEQFMQTATLPADGSAQYALSDLLQGVSYSNGSVKITADKGVAAFALYSDVSPTKRNGSCYAGISAVDPERISTFTYGIPYFFKDGDNYTSMALRNADTLQSAEVTVHVYDQDGGGLFQDIVPLEAEGQNAFVFNDAGTGWIKVFSDRVLAGLSWIGAIQDGWPVRMADISLNADISVNLLIPHVAQDENWDTTVFVCNPNDNIVTVQMRFVDENGDTKYSQTIILPANGSERVDLSELVQGNNFSNGSLEISATQNVSAFALYYDTNPQKRNGSCFAGITAVDIDS